MGPEVFGLHGSAEINYLNNSSTSLLANLVELQPRTVAGEGGSTHKETVRLVAADIIR